MIQCGFDRNLKKKNLAKLLKVAQERKRRKNKRSFEHYSNANEEKILTKKKKKKKSPSDVRAVMTTFNILRGKPRTLKPAPDIAPALHIGWRAFLGPLSFSFFLSPFFLLPPSNCDLVAEPSRRHRRRPLSQPTAPSLALARSSNVAPSSQLLVGWLYPPVCVARKLLVECSLTWPLSFFSFECENIWMTLYLRAGAKFFFCCCCCDGFSGL